MKVRAGAVLFSVLVGSAAMAEAPVPVSPGGTEAVARVAGRCPTFHWTPTAGAERLELVVYRISTGEAEGPIERVLAVTLPGTATGWTPSLDQCLEYDTLYAWTISDGRDSPPANLFEVPPGPLAAEVEAAREVLRLSPRGESSAPEPSLEVEAFGASARAIRGEADSTDIENPAEASGPRTAPFPSASPAFVVDEQIHLGSKGDIFREGLPFLWTDAGPLSSVGSVALGMAALRYSTGDNNTAVGHTALKSNTTGERNSAFGEDALLQNTVGSSNSAFGEDALILNTYGYSNSAFGVDALSSNTWGYNNIAVGVAALNANSNGVGNVAIGSGTLLLNVTGDSNVAVGTYSLEESGGNSNTAVGHSALNNLDTGSNNIAIGRSAGLSLTGGTSNTILIGNSGAGGVPDNTIMIGDDSHDSAFIAGVRNVTTGEDDAVAVLIDSEGQLGTTSSRRAVKQDVREIGALSRRLASLRPVAFRYRRHALEHPETPLQFGLIAEEVAEVFPELVVFDQENRPLTVKYHLLSSLLLNELQSQRRQNLVQWGLLGLFAATSLGLRLIRRRSLPS